MGVPKSFKSKKLVSINAIVYSEKIFFSRPLKVNCLHLTHNPKTPTYFIWCFFSSYFAPIFKKVLQNDAEWNWRWLDYIKFLHFNTHPQTLLTLLIFKKKNIDKDNMCEVEDIKAAATVASVISIQTYDALLK